MGLGLAAPYLVLAALPGFARVLPRPGRWMDLVRQVLAFPMYGACAWLFWVMGQEAGSAGVAATAAGLVLVGFVAWAARAGSAQPRGRRAGPRGRRILHAAALAAALAALAVLSGIAASPAVPAALASRTSAPEAGMERFSAARLEALRQEGRPVFVNMTAAWCVTCLVNERVALDQPAVRQAFASRGVVYLKGDWTLQDAGITRFLRSHGRDGVPLYVLYPPGAPGPGAAAADPDRGHRAVGAEDDVGRRGRIRPRLPRAGRAPSRRRPRRARRSTACPASPRRRRSGSCACPGRRAASSRCACAARAPAPAPPHAAWASPARGRRRGGAGGSGGRRHRRDGAARERRQGGAGHAARRVPWSALGVAFPADRRGAAIEVQPVRLADDGVFRNAHAPADLGGRMPFGPKFPEAGDVLFRPLHIVGIPSCGHKILWRHGGRSQSRK